MNWRQPSPVRTWKRRRKELTKLEKLASLFKLLPYLTLKKTCVPTAAYRNIQMIMTPITERIDGTARIIVRETRCNAVAWRRIRNARRNRNGRPICARMPEGVAGKSVAADPQERKSSKQFQGCLKKSSGRGSSTNRRARDSRR
mmetsp:Transcript_7549/g.22662  ORF Transcript_7549/g.22662 Transcript_7549/m.22662 type:complete len:144 (+) Transcript_7549:752-1183(+)